MLAPNQVSAPATIHTSNMPPNVGTARLTSDGWTKIDEPTMVPTTMAVACVKPIERSETVVSSFANPITDRRRRVANPVICVRQVDR